MDSGAAVVADVVFSSPVVAVASVSLVSGFAVVVASGSTVTRSWTGGFEAGGSVITSMTNGVTVVAGTGVVVALGPNILLRSAVVGLIVVNLNTDGFCVTISSRPSSSSDGQMNASAQHCSGLTPVGLQPLRGGSSQMRSAQTISPKVHLQNVHGFAVWITWPCSTVVPWTLQGFGTSSSSSPGFVVDGAVTAGVVSPVGVVASGGFLRPSTVDTAAGVVTPSQS